MTGHAKVVCTGGIMARGGEMGVPAGRRLEVRDLLALFSRMATTEPDDVVASKSSIAVPASGAPDVSHMAACWKCSPHDMLGEILSKFPLWELSRLSATCPTFRTIFQWQLKVQQKARCELAVKRFGCGRIQRVADLTERFLRGKPMDLVSPDKNWVGFWILAGGELHVDGKESPLSNSDLARSALFAAGNIGVTIERRHGTLPTHMRISWGEWRQRQLELDLCDNGNMSRRPSSSPLTVNITPRSNQKLQGVALLQALLSGDYGPALRTGGRALEIRLRWCDPKNGDMQKEVEDLQAQIAPLLPFASRCTAMGWDTAPIRVPQL